MQSRLNFSFWMSAAKSNSNNCLMAPSIIDMLTFHNQISWTHFPPAIQETIPFLEHIFTFYFRPSLFSAIPGSLSIAQHQWWKISTPQLILIYFDWLFVMHCCSLQAYQFKPAPWHFGLFICFPPLLNFCERLHPDIQLLMRSKINCISVMTLLQVARIGLLSV